MTLKEHKKYFYIILIGCFILIFFLAPPLRNYIPIIWGAIGFGINGYLFYTTWTNLSSDLIDNHKEILNSKNILYRVTHFKKTVDMFDLFDKSKGLEMISMDIKNSLLNFRTYVKLMIIAFLMFGIMGVLTVVLTWK